MVIKSIRALALATAIGVIGLNSNHAANPNPPKETPSFGVLKTPALKDVQSLADTWIKSLGQISPEKQKAYQAIWTTPEGTAEKLAATFSLLVPEAAVLLEEARNSKQDPPAEIPAFFKDASKPLFLKANLAVAYSRILGQNKNYEIALDTLKLFQPEQVADPAAYLFHRSVAEYSLMMKKEADDTINRLLDDVSESPERYRNVASLMAIDMMTWQEKDLGWISRKMEIIQRRLDLGQGGKKTQKMQKEVVARLDEMIKEMENQSKNSTDSSGNCPAGGPPSQGNPGNNVQASSPQQDSIGGNGAGKGQIDQKRVRELAEVWGKLPERERAKAMVELTRSLPPKYREAVEIYFKRLGEANPAP